MQRAWTTDEICVNAAGKDLPVLAEEVYQKVCRFHFDQPGVSVVKLGQGESVACRQMMVDLMNEMNCIHQTKTLNSLIPLSAARFDQQETTRLHLDGGPEQCFLMLGYEPSEVESVLKICDYTKFAYDLGLSPQEFMVKHNPMFHHNSDLLDPYITELPHFVNDEFQIVCINNSSAGYSKEEPRWQGTLHTATILNPNETKRRVVNSMMIASVPQETSDVIGRAELSEFITTTAVRRKGYDKPHLKDD